jgi:DNA-binding PadR family transcriptional regulator
MMLTELEGCVLGMIAVKGPCTTYAVRREFQKSPSQHWSASAGAVYPLTERLRRRRLLRVDSKTSNGRNGNLYGLTPAGKQALHRWLSPPLAEFITSVPPDPLRNRVAFLSALSRKQQTAFLVAARHQLEAHLNIVRQYVAQNYAAGNHYEYLISDGAQCMLSARLDWLLRVSEFLDR